MADGGHNVDFKGLLNSQSVLSPDKVKGYVEEHSLQGEELRNFLDTLNKHFPEASNIQWHEIFKLNEAPVGSSKPELGIDLKTWFRNWVNPLLARASALLPRLSPERHSGEFVHIPTIPKWSPEVAHLIEEGPQIRRRENTMQGVEVSPGKHFKIDSQEAQMITSMGRMRIEVATTPGHPERSRYKQNEDGFAIASLIDRYGHHWILSVVIDEAGGVPKPNRIKSDARKMIEKRISGLSGKIVDGDVKDYVNSEFRRINEEMKNSTTAGAAGIIGVLIDDGFPPTMHGFNASDPVIYTSNGGTLNLANLDTVGHTKGRPLNEVTGLMGHAAFALKNPDISLDSPLVAGPAIVLATDGLCANKASYDQQNQRIEGLGGVERIHEILKIGVTLSEQDIKNIWGQDLDKNTITLITRVIENRALTYAQQAVQIAGLLGSRDNITCMTISFEGLSTDDLKHPEVQERIKSWLRDRLKSWAMGSDGYRKGIQEIDFSLAATYQNMQELIDATFDDLTDKLFVIGNLVIEDYPEVVADIKQKIKEEILRKELDFNAQISKIENSNKADEEKLGDAKVLLEYLHVLLMVIQNDQLDGSTKSVVESEITPKIKQVVDLVATIPKELISANREFVETKTKLSRALRGIT